MSEWISVTDRMPEPEQKVLVIAQSWWNQEVYVGRLHGANDWELFGVSYYKALQVTHWMEIPELPEWEMPD